MEFDTSENSDCENNTLEWTYMMLDTATLTHNIEAFCDTDDKKAEDIESVVLHHNQLNTLPINIYNFTNLQILDVSYNGLTTLPDVLFHCRLTNLIAKNNSLTNESLPKNFTHSTVLKEINLSGNNLTVFPEQILDFPNLKFLHLSGNSISNISNNIHRLRSLQLLALGGNKLTEVAAAVGELKVLQVLMLCDNLLESLPPSIANLHNLKSLLLHKNRLRTLPPEIVALRNLHELSLRDNPLVVQFVSDMTHNPGSLLELAARSIKLNEISVEPGDIPTDLLSYLDSAHRCVNPKCKGVYFDNRVEHIKFVDFCGKYRIPLLQYLCSSKCVTPRSESSSTSSDKEGASRFMMKKVLLG